MLFDKLYRSSYFVSPRDFIKFFQHWLLLTGILCFLAMKLHPGCIQHSTWHLILGYNHAIEVLSSSPGRFIFVPMWTYGCHFLIAGVKLSIQRSTIEGHLSKANMFLKNVVCGLWATSACAFPLVGAFEEPRVRLSIVIYAALAMSFHLYGLFEFLEYKQKGAHGFALWVAFRFLLNGAMLAMIIYDYWEYLEHDGDGPFEPPVPSVLLQITEYTTYLSTPVTEYFMPATDSMEVRTTVTHGAITKEVGPVPTYEGLEPALAIASHSLGAHWGLNAERRSQPEGNLQALLQASCNLQAISPHSCERSTLASSLTFAPRQTMTRMTTERHKMLRRLQSIRTPGRVYDAIVFEGGGTKGTAYAGAVKKLQENGLMGSIRKIGGTSAGAQTAVLVAVGYSGDELADVARHTPWDQVFDFDQGFGWTFRAAWNIKTRLGACRGEFLLKYLEALIKTKVGQDWLTFQQLYDKTGIDLHLGVSNVTVGNFQFLTKETHGDMPLALGAMASSSIPFLFPPVRWGGHMYMDGGVGGNLPTKAFPGTRLLACKLQTACDDDQPIDYETFSGYLAGVTDVIFSCAQCVGGQCEDKMARAKEKSMRRDFVRGIGIDIVHVDCGDCGVVETSMPLERINKVIQLGYESMTEFLDTSEDSDFEEDDEENALLLEE